VRFTGLLLLVLGLLGACGYAPPAPKGQAVVTAGSPSPVAGADDFNAGAGKTPVTLPDGLQYIDLVIGAGQMPQKCSNLTMHYTGWLSTGSKFDSSRDRNQPFTFEIGAGQVIKGWDEGIQSMRTGGKRKLTLPPALGYGSSAQGSTIPANSTLVFVVELISVQPGPSPAADGSCPVPSPSPSP